MHTSGHLFPPRVALLLSLTAVSTTIVRSVGHSVESSSRNCFPCSVANCSSFCCGAAEMRVHHRAIVNSCQKAPRAAASFSKPVAGLVAWSPRRRLSASCPVVQRLCCGSEDVAEAQGRASAHARGRLLVCVFVPDALTRSRHHPAAAVRGLRAVRRAERAALCLEPIAS